MHLRPQTQQHAAPQAEESRCAGCRCKPLRTRTCGSCPSNARLIRSPCRPEEGTEWGSLDSSAHRKAREKEDQLQANKGKSTAELLQEVRAPRVRLGVCAVSGTGPAGGVAGGGRSAGPTQHTASCPVARRCTRTRTRRARPACQRLGRRADQSARDARRLPSDGQRWQAGAGKGARARACRLSGRGAALRPQSGLARHVRTTAV